MKNIRKIVVRSTNWIGDAVMTTPALTLLRKRFPDARITVAARPWVLPVFSANPCVNRTIAVTGGNGITRLSSVWHDAAALRHENFDLALLFPNSFDAAFTSWLAGIPLIAGYATDMRSILLTDSVPVPHWKRNSHEIFYYLNLVESLEGRQTDGIEQRKPSLMLRIPRDAADWAHEFMARKGILEHDLVIGFNPGAAFGPAKCWPVENFRDLGRMLLADRILSQRKIWILVLGTEKEQKTADTICASLGETALNLAGCTDLPQVMGVIERLDLLVTNDSGLMHVGAALDRPLVALFGSTNPLTTGPWSNKSRIVQNALECSPCLKRQCPANFTCMKDLQPVKVFDACMERLRKYAL